MNCPDYQHWLEQHLDGTAGAEPAELREHLAACTDCRERHHAARRLDAGLRLLVPPTPPADLKHRIVVGMLAQHRHSLRRRRLLWTGAALAASLLLAVTGYSLLRPRNPEPAIPDLVRTPPPSLPAETPSLRASVAEAGSLMAALGRRTMDQAFEQGRPLLPAMVPSAFTNLNLDAAFEPPSFREAGHGVSAGLEPVTNSARRALALFQREVPPLEATPKIEAGVP